MRLNLTKESKRGADLERIRTRTKDLGESAQAFRRGAGKVKKNMKWKENRTCLLVSVGILVLLGLIALSSMYFAA